MNRIVVLCFLCFFSSQCVAGTTVYGSEKNIKFSYLEGSFFEKELKGEGGYIDNYFYQNDDKQSEQYLSLTPKIFIQKQEDTYLLQFHTQLNSYKFIEFNDDDHTSTLVGAKYYYKLSDTLRLFMTSGYEDYFQDRGTALTQGAGESIAEGDVLQNYFYNAGFKYGQLDSIGNAELILGQNYTQYTTRRSVTKELDFYQSFAELTLNYAISEQVYIASKFDYTKATYDNDPQLTRDELTALLGMKWETASENQLSVLLGYQKLAFDDPYLADNNTFRWQVAATWSPIERLKLLMNSARATQQGENVEASYRIVDTTTLTVRYDNTDYFSTAISTGFVEEDTIFVDSTLKETYLSTDIRFDYEWSTLLKFYLKYQFSNQNSDQAIYEYQRNVVSIGFNFGI